MHPLTKVFIVLQALLSVVVAALAVPLAVNNDTWKERYQVVDAKRQAADSTAVNARTELGIVNESRAREAQAFRDQITQLQSHLASKQTEMGDLRSRLSSAMQASDAVNARIDTLTATAQTQANIINTQMGEISRRRDDSIALQRRNIELEDQLRDTLSRLDVALDAQRILQEQIARLNEQMEQVRQGGGLLAQATPEDETAFLPSPPIAGRVLRVEEAAGTKFAEIDLGTRDGVAENMKFTVSRGGTFVANLIITKVDVNRAVGRLELEQADGVAVNDRITGGVRR